MEQNCRENVALSEYTTLALGGPARYLCECADLEAARRIVGTARAHGLRLHILGKGSNTVFLDRGFDGVVLQVALRGVERYADGEGGAVLRVAAGENWDALVIRAIRDGLSGIECLSGIPGSVGATPMQNVGAYGQEVSQTIAQVEAMDLETLDEVIFAPDECGFGYRTSRFKEQDFGRYLITSVHFRLRTGHPAEPHYPELRHVLEGTELSLTAIRTAVLGLRRRKSMLLDPLDPNSRSVGSFFTNPVLSDGALQALRTRVRNRLGQGAEPPAYAADGGHKISAAWLIEHAGFVRGYRQGGAAISDNHTLALVNRGGTSEDLLALGAQIAETVQEVFGVELRREPMVVE